MSRRVESPVAVQLWGCLRCAQTYESFVRLAAPPTHHCPTPRANRTRQFVLQYEKAGAQ